jgi:hypothetical protein
MNTRLLLEELEEREKFRQTGADGRIKVTWILQKKVVRIWTGFIWL